MFILGQAMKAQRESRDVAYVSSLIPLNVRVKSHLPSAGIISSSPYFPR